MTEFGAARGEASFAADGASAPRSAGAMLRMAREREGLHLAVLAATIKVSAAKLEALEQDRHDLLPNATFARALAQSVCRSLKIDPRPVLALLPQLEVLPPEGTMGALNTPFHERPSRGVGGGSAWASKPMFVAGGLLLLAAVVIGLMPADWMEGLTPSALQAAVQAPPPAASAPAVSTVVQPAARIESPAPVAATAGPAPTMPASAQVTVRTTPTPLPPAPSEQVAQASPVALPASAAGLLRLAAQADSWVEVVDARGRPLLSRIVQGGEALSLDGVPPLRLKVGNAGATKLSFRGQPLDLTPHTRDNVARLELR